jgi:transcriptional antiterminator NusG
LVSDSRQDEHPASVEGTEESPQLPAEDDSTSAQEAAQESVADTPVEGVVAPEEAPDQSTMAAGGDESDGAADSEDRPAPTSPSNGETEVQAQTEKSQLPEEETVDEGIVLEQTVEEEVGKEWFILKVQVNREDSIRDALIRRIKIEGLDEHFGDIVVPTEDVAEFNKSGKRRIVKRKLYPGYILVNMAITDDTWFLVRETPGVGDFTGSAGKPTPMDPREVERILRLGQQEEEGAAQVKTAIPFKLGDRVRVKDGNFQNFEGDVESIDEANGRITVVITIFNRSTPVELEHWQLEAV